MLKIKLARFGKRSQPHFRVVVNEARDKRDGKYIANLGHYAPTQVPKVLQIDLEAYKEWMKKGAQPTETVASLVARLESGNPFPPRPARPSKKARAKAQAASEASATPEESSETPVAETTPTEETASTEETTEETASTTAAAS